METERMIPVVLLGCGGVGQQLLHHIIHSRSLHLQLRLRLLVVGIADSRSFITPPPHLLLDRRSPPPLTPSAIPSFSDDFLLHLCRLKSASSSHLPPDLLAQCHVFPAPDAPNQIIRLASLLAKTTGLVLVDCSATSDTIKILQHGLHLGCCVVLANKKPLTSKMDDYEKLVSRPRHIRYESTVGAGLPVITSLARVISSGDSIFRIVGSFSGTLGYVMSELETVKPLSQVVRAAKNLGYTEPDPRDDLGGMDVARKALILARLLGWKINLEDIKVDSLYPDAMKPDKMTIKDFMEKGLPLLDKNMEEKVQNAFSNGKVVRYVCIIEDSRCQVGLLELPKDSPLGRLRGSDNIVEVYSRCYKEQPLVIQGAGAGNDTTAAGVLADIIDLQDLFPS